MNVNLIQLNVTNIQHVITTKGHLDVCVMWGTMLQIHLALVNFIYLFCYQYYQGMRI